MSEMRRVGEIVNATVVEVKDKQATLEIDGMVGVDAYIFDDKYSRNPNETIKNSLKVGDIIEVKIMKINLDDTNYILVSRLPLLERENQEKVRDAFNKKETIDVKVKKNVNKGLLADYKGVEIFIPESQIDLGEIKPLAEYVGQTLSIKVIDKKFDRNREKYTGSHRAVVQGEIYAKRAIEIEKINEGDIVRGVVSSFEPYGIVIQIGIIRGVLKYNQVSHLRGEKAETILSVGDEVTLKVIKKEGNKIDLSRKVLLPTPFNIFVEKNPVSTKVMGKVVQKLEIGMILEVAKEVTGLIHKSEYSWNPNDNLDRCLKIGDEIEVAIINIDAKRERISLSRKALIDNPWARVNAKKGEVLPVEITAITPGKGVTVLASGVDGFISINDLSMDKISKIEDLFAVGDKFDAMVTDVNKNLWILKLSVKELKEKENREQFEKYMNEQTEDAAPITVGDIFGDAVKK